MAGSGKGTGKGGGKGGDTGSPPAPGRRKGTTSGKGKGKGGGRGRKQSGEAARRWQQVESLVRRLEPEIIAIFRRHEIDPEVATDVLEEVVTLLLYRWGQVSRPEIWVLEMVDKRIEARLGKGSGRE